MVAVVAIAAFSRSRKTNVVQKMLGEYFKMSNTGKQGLQLLQRLGITLVPKSIRENQDTIGTHFLAEVKESKNQIESWHERRIVLETLAKTNHFHRNNASERRELTVKYESDKFAEKILDLAEYLTNVGSDVPVEPDQYCLDELKLMLVKLVKLERVICSSS